EPTGSAEGAARRQPSKPSGGKGGQPAPPPENRSAPTGFMKEKPPPIDQENRSLETQKPVTVGPKTHNSHARSRSQYIRILNEKEIERDSDSVSSLSSFSSQVDRERLKPSNLPFIKAGGEGGGEAQEPAEY